MDLGLTGRHVLVTGGGSGIGRAVCLAVVAEGGIPLLIDRDPLEPAFEAELLQRQPRARAFRAELTRDTEAQQAVQAALREAGGELHGLVNNAGVNDGAGLDASPAAFRRSLERNLVHAFTVTQACRAALARARGAVVNIASKTAVTGQGGTSGYCAAKGGLLSLTREWALDLRLEGVRVNAVVPAEVMTPQYERWLSGFDDPAAKLAEISRRIPLGQRMTTPQELASAVLFLLSAPSAHTTGQWVFVDGGYTHLDRAID